MGQLTKEKRTKITKLFIFSREKRPSDPVDSDKFKEPVAKKKRRRKLKPTN